MDAAQVKALATELEITLGLVGELIGELQGHAEAWTGSVRLRQLVDRLAARPNLGVLPAVLLRAHADISGILGGIRLTREAIEAHTVQRIRDTKEKLSDVTTTTESATLELLDGLDRSLELINSLEAEAQGASRAGGYQSLREQVSALYNHLQFQDITAQQLQGVGQALLDLETRVAAVAALFDQALHGGPGSALLQYIETASSADLSYNPEATMNRTRADQAMVDEAFRGARHGAVSPGTARS
jgi:hypothetical protein